MCVHAVKGEHDGSGRGLWDGVDTVYIVWVLVWVWRRGQDTMGGFEIASTCTNVIDPLGPIRGFILNLKSKSTIPVVWCESVDEGIIRESLSLLNIFSAFTLSSNSFVWFAWKQEHCCHLHRIFPSSMESPQSCHLSSLCNLMLSSVLCNWHPCWWRKSWHMLCWAGRWGRCNLPGVDMDLGRRVKWGSHSHLCRCHHNL